MRDFDVQNRNSTGYTNTEFPKVKKEIGRKSFCIINYNRLPNCLKVTNDENKIVRRKIKHYVCKF